METIKHVFKISREDYGDNIVSYDNVRLVAINRLDLGSNLSFEWGDTSSGADALSYAVLSKVGSKEIASRYSKSYTKDVVSKVHKDTWTLDAISVVQWINKNTNFSIDENAFKHGDKTYLYEERRQEDRRKEERRVKREKDFQEEAQRRLKIYEAKQEEQRKGERRKSDRRMSPEEDCIQRAQKRIQELQTEHQNELEHYKKLIIKKNDDIKSYQAELKKYKLYIESLNIKGS